MKEFVEKARIFLRRQADDFLDLVFPPYCGLCGLPADSDDRLVCERCWESIQGLEAPYCSGCKRLLPQSIRCPDCRPAPMVIFSLGYYDTNMQTILHDLKFTGLKPLAVTIGNKLARAVSDKKDAIKIDLILPVPLHSSRLAYRGFNQAEEIARGIAAVLDIPLDTDLLRSVRKTKQQARLPAIERESNVRGAYAVNDEDGFLKGKTILLVDDVTTTGATLRENEKVLLGASAKRVVAAVAATAV